MIYRRYSITCLTRLLLKLRTTLCEKKNGFFDFIHSRVYNVILSRTVKVTTNVGRMPIYITITIIYTITTSTNTRPRYLKCGRPRTTINNRAWLKIPSRGNISSRWNVYTFYRAMLPFINMLNYLRLKIDRSFKVHAVRSNINLINNIMI